MLFPLKVLSIVAFFLLLIFFSPSTVKAAIIGGPFVAAPKKAIRRALQLAGLKSGEEMYDMGSGLGRVLVIGAKEFGAKVTGLEYSVPLIFFSKMNLFLHGIKNGKILREDFYKADFSKADVIFIFMAPKAFPKLKDRFNENIKKGTRIVVYSSRPLFWEPDKVESVEGAVGKIYLYIKK